MNTEQLEKGWRPVKIIESGELYEVIFWNNIGEEFRLTDFYTGDYPHDCWDDCSGDRPGCKQDCPIYNISYNR